MQNQHLGDSERAHYEDSINKLSKADSLEKLLLWIIALIAAVGLAITIVNAQTTQREAKAAQQRQSQLLQQIKKTADAQNTVNQQKLDRLQQHIDCIVALFQKPNRQTLVLSDITECKFTSVSSSGGTTGGTKSTVTAPTSKPSPSNQVQSNAGSGQQNIPPPVDNRVEILGIPLCVPLTDICAKH